MKKLPSRNDKRLHRARRVRAKISGTAERPRVSVFRSLTNISLQLIDDETNVTICAASLTDAPKNAKNNVEGAFAVGSELAKKCKQSGIEQVVFDRAGYRYHGRVKAVAEGIRDAGIII